MYDKKWIWYVQKVQCLYWFNFKYVLKKYLPKKLVLSASMN